MTGDSAPVPTRQCVLHVEGVYDWFQTGSPVVDVDLNPDEQGRYPRAVLGWVGSDFNWAERPRVRIHYEDSDIYRPGDAHPRHYGLDLDSSTGMLHLREWFVRRFGRDGDQHDLIYAVTGSSAEPALRWVLRANAVRMVQGLAPYKHVATAWDEGWDGMERGGPDNYATVYETGWVVQSVRGTTWSGPETGEAGMLAADQAAHAHGIWCVGYSERQEP